MEGAGCADTVAQRARRRALYQGPMRRRWPAAIVASARSARCKALRMTHARTFVPAPLFRAARLATPVLALALLAACGTTLPSDPLPADAGAGGDAVNGEGAGTAVEVLGEVRTSRHAGDDDLLTAGLGLAGLRAPMPPAAADPLAPTAAELRRIAFHANWRGIADLTPGGGVEALFAELPRIEGEEHSALLRLPGRNAPHRVVVQVPDGFDAQRPCIVVAPASGSRGVYGAIAVAGPWALPKGCVLALTDKGAGTDVFDPASGTGTALDGTRAAAGAGAPLAFVPPGFAAPVAGETRVALRHLHSMDNPEADWGAHVLQAARFALDVVAGRTGRSIGPGDARILAVGISNGGGAVLRAAELDDGLIDAVVAGEPNISVAGTRSLFDYATEAALLQPCALLDPRLAGVPFNGPALAAAATARCASLRSAGLVQGEDTAAQAASAYDTLLASGWSEEALQEAGLNTAFDLWRAVAAGYASAYARSAWDAMPCGYGYAVMAADGTTPIPAPPAGLAMWWAMGSGIPPMLGIGLLDSMAAASPSDPAFAGLQCLRGLHAGQDDAAAAVQRGIAEVRATGAPRVPTIVLHGRDDGLIPPVFTSRPYAAMAARGEHFRYWEIDNAQHFDAFLAVPDMFVRYVPMLPFVWQALDQAVAALDGGPAPAPSQRVRTTPRSSPAPLGPAQTGGLRADPGADAIGPGGTPD